MHNSRRDGLLSMQDSRSVLVIRQKRGSIIDIRLHEKVVHNLRYDHMGVFFDVLYRKLAVTGQLSPHFYPKVSNIYPFG